MIIHDMRQAAFHILFSAVGAPQTVMLPAVIDQMAKMSRPAQKLAPNLDLTGPQTRSVLPLGLIVAQTPMLMQPSSDIRYGMCGRVLNERTFKLGCP